MPSCNVLTASLRFDHTHDSSLPIIGPTIIGPTAIGLILIGPHSSTFEIIPFDSNINVHKFVGLAICFFAMGCAPCSLHRCITGG